MITVKDLCIGKITKTQKIRIPHTLIIVRIAGVVAMWHPVEAQAEEQKTVRVGYVNVKNYEEGGEGEYKRGAGYEYPQKISYLTGNMFTAPLRNAWKCWQKSS